MDDEDKKSLLDELDLATGSWAKEDSRKITIGSSNVTMNNPHSTLTPSISGGTWNTPVIHSGHYSYPTYIQTPKSARETELEQKVVLLETWITNLMKIIENIQERRDGNLREDAEEE